MPLFKSFLCSARKLKVNSVKVMELLCLWVLCQGERCSRGFHQLLFFSEKKKKNKKINKQIIDIKPNRRKGGKQKIWGELYSIFLFPQSLEPRGAGVSIVGAGDSSTGCALLAARPYHYLLPPCRRQFRWYFHATNAASAKAVLFKESVIS